MSKEDEAPPPEAAYRWFAVLNGPLGDVVLRAPTRADAVEQAKALGEGAYAYGEYNAETHWYSRWEWVPQWKEWAEVEEGFNLPFRPVRPFDLAEN